MDKVNLDAMRQARREAKGESAGAVTFGGEDFELPAEIPASVLDGLGAVTKGDASGLRTAIVDLLGEEQAMKFYRHKPSVQDLMELLKVAVAQSGLGEDEGGELGESSASDASS